MKPTAEVVLRDRRGGPNQLRLVRQHDGQIWAEVCGYHGGRPIFSSLRLGEVWELIPKLSELR